jgi:hypothetical protein
MPREKEKAFLLCGLDPIANQCDPLSEPDLLASLYAPDEWASMPVWPIGRSPPLYAGPPVRRFFPQIPCHMCAPVIGNPASAAPSGHPHCLSLLLQSCLAYTRCLGSSYPPHVAELSPSLHQRAHCNATAPPRCTGMSHLTTSRTQRIAAGLNCRLPYVRHLGALYACMRFSQLPCHHLACAVCCVAASAQHPCPPLAQTSASEQNRVASRPSHAAADNLGLGLGYSAPHVHPQRQPRPAKPCADTLCSSALASLKCGYKRLPSCILSAPPLPSCPLR